MRRACSGCLNEKFQRRSEVHGCSGISAEGPLSATMELGIGAADAIMRPPRLALSLTLQMGQVETLPDRRRSTEGAALLGTPRSPHPHGALDEHEFLLKSRGPPEQLGIRQPVCIRYPAGRESIVMAQPTNLLQDNHANARSGEQCKASDGC